jgi:hypothetical protein
LGDPLGWVIRSVGNYVTLLVLIIIPDWLIELNFSERNFFAAR